MFSLNGKTAVVTGGASGIGLATARRFAEAGATVVIADISDASELASEISGVFVSTDVTQEDQVKALMDKAAQTSGRIDIVINNAGGSRGIYDLVSQLSAEDFEFAFNLNLMGVVFGMKHAVSHMTNGGSIVNMSSTAGVLGAQGYGPYVAAKASVIGVTMTAALEFAPNGVRVNCVCPGAVDTPLLHRKGVDPKSLKKTDVKLGTLMMPLGRLCRPEEVAALLHFLAADDCSFISGQAICIDGGMTAGFGSELLESALGGR
jgi:3alpha(or 20beta)-hydroxysteroid dehydrogenase